MNQMSVRDLGLSAWIICAMLIGFLVSEVFPQVVIMIEGLSWHGTNIPLAIVMIAMLYPTFAKVPIERLGDAVKQPKVLGLSLILNWVIGPILMLLCALVFLHGHADYMVGLILVGIARCIAMVVLWNDLAGGDEITCASLVAFNSLFQCLTYAFYAYFFLWVVLPFLGFHVVAGYVAFADVLTSVGVYLGLPFAAGLVTQLLRRTQGDVWYRQRFMNKVSPIGMYALLATIALLFMFNGDMLAHHLYYTFLIAVPLIVYFSAMFVLSVCFGSMAGLKKPQKISLAFTAASNNFELAIAVAIATFGVQSNVAFAAIVGPLIEVPVMLLLVRLSGLMKP